MCGRYNFNPNDIDYLKEHFELFLNIPYGDIYPSSKGLVLFGDDNHIKGSLKTFGLKRKSLIVNARQETVTEKPTFKNLKHCVVPCSAFYEWTPQKEMVTFYKEGQILYLAALYEKDEFVILTTNANASVKDVHPRMPLILPENLISKWIFSGNDVQSLLKTEPISLDRFRQFEQLSLF